MPSVFLLRIMEQTVEQDRDQLYESGFFFFYFFFFFFFAGWSIPAELFHLEVARTDDSFRYFLRNLSRFNIVKCDCKRKGSEEAVVSAWKFHFISPHNIFTCNIFTLQEIVDCVAGSMSEMIIIDRRVLLFNNIGWAKSFFSPILIYNKLNDKNSFTL